MTEKYQCPEGGFTFVWNIKKFSYCSYPQNNSFVSPNFVESNLCDTWHLQLYPRGFNNISVHCRIVRTIVYKGVEVDIQFCAGTSKEVLYVQKLENSSDCTVDFGREIIENLPDDTLVLHCHLRRRSSDSSGNPVHCFAETRMLPYQFVVHQEVKKFSSLQLGDKVLTTLAYPNHSSLSMILRMFLVGGNLEDASVEVRMNVKDLIKEKFSTCVLYIMDDSGKTRRHMPMPKQSSLGRIESEGKFSIKRSELIAEGFPNDTLILRGEMIVSGYVETGTLQQVVYGLQTKEAVAALIGDPPPLPPPSPKCPPSVGLSSDMMALYKGDGPPSDFVVITAGGRLFPVHQTVLGARSPFFCAMFANERQSLELTTDLNDETVEQMLKYAYSDEEPPAGLSCECLIRLYSAADKYAFVGLREVCAERLLESIDVASAPKIVQVANQLGDSLLKAKATDFIYAQGQVAIECKEWKEIEQEDPKLAVDVLRQMVLMNLVKSE